jgi:hypothetical protein
MNESKCEGRRRGAVTFFEEVEEEEDTGTML